MQKRMSKIDEARRPWHQHVPDVVPAARVAGFPNAPSLARPSALLRKFGTTASSSAMQAVSGMCAYYVWGPVNVVGFSHTRNKLD